MCNILYRMQNVNEFYTVISLKTFSFEIVFFIFIRCNIQTNLRLTSNNLLTITKFTHSKCNALKKIFQSKHTFEASEKTSCHNRETVCSCNLYNHRKHGQNFDPVCLLAIITPSKSNNNIKKESLSQDKKRLFCF